MSESEETYRPSVHTQADLEEVWRHLMGPLGFSGHSVWVMHIAADRRPVPELMQISDCEDVPEPEEAGGLVEVLARLDEAEPGGSVAFLLSRPGRGLRPGDLAWAAFLHEAGRAAAVPLEVVHLAHDEDVVPLPLDALPLATPA